MKNGLDQQRRAVHSGYWPLIRYNPSLVQRGQNPLALDSGEPTIPLRDFTDNELRFRILARTDPATADRLLAEAEVSNLRRVWLYKSLAGLHEPE
jgi:pyruvate-ferredoxin/flavodoxin oxidoreductase